MGQDITNIEQIVCREYRCPGVLLRTRSRKQTIAEARQVCMFFSLTLLSMGTVTAGQEYNRTHATVIHARRHVRDLYRYDKEFRCRMTRLGLILNVNPEIFTDET